MSSKLTFHLEVEFLIVSGIVNRWAPVALELHYYNKLRNIRLDGLGL